MSFKDEIEELEKYKNIYREIAINSEMQWRKLHGEVVPYIQRESVELYIDSLAKEKMSEK